MSSIDGQYRGPAPAIRPVNIGERSKPDSRIEWVRALVRAMWQTTALVTEGVGVLVKGHPSSLGKRNPVWWSGGQRGTRPRRTERTVS